MNDLPDVILGRVLAEAGRRQGRSIPLVCKRWLRVFYSQPELWSTLEVRLPHEIAHCSSPEQTDHWFASTHARLQRCGQLVEVLHVCDAHHMQQAGVNSQWGWQLADLLRCLPPPAAAASSGAGVDSSASTGGRLARLGLGSPPIQNTALPAGVLPWLQSQTGLTRLQLWVGSLPPGTPSALRQLNRLLDLQLTCGPLPEGRMGNALLHLRQLTRLFLQADELPAALCQLTCLQQLQDVSLAQVHGEPLIDIVLPAPAAFGQLSTCSYSSGTGRIQVDGTAVRIRRCFVSVKEGTVTIAGTRLAPLAPLLAAMLPAHVPLRALQIHNCVLTPAALQDCPCLATVTRLVLNQCEGFADSGIGAPLDALLEQTPHLASLSLEECLEEEDEGELPACLLASQGLREIGLHGNHLIGLPEGPYLGTSLEVLDLSGNSLEVVPAALAAATGLTKLDMSDNDDLEVTGDDVASVLMHMPRLQQLALDGANASLSALMTLARALPQLMLDDMGLPDMIKLSAAAD